jgi:RNA polymerase sigma-70 factor (ECF subfamily)
VTSEARFEEAREGTGDGPSLLAACREGDREAFRRLVETHRDRVYTLAMHLTRSETAAAEIVQVVFVKVFRALPKFRGEARFETWLHRIAVNCCRDEMRRSRRDVSWEEDAAGSLAESSPERDASVRQERDIVWKAVGRLPRRLRIPVVLRYVEEMSYEEIGRVLRWRPGTVASRLNRARAELARSLADLRREDRP